MLTADGGFPVTPDHTIGGLLAQGIRFLREHSIENARTEAEVLLSHVLSRNRADIYAHPEEEVEVKSAGRYSRALSLRAAGKPLQYITGATDFFNVTVAVNPHVLIPRPETEVLVASVLEEVRRARGTNEASPLRILDVGTGSGAIILALACALRDELPLVLVATDVSPDALEVARTNFARYGLERLIDLREGDMFGALRTGESFHVIVSNPPYVSLRELPLLPVEVRDSEPRVALVSGETGFEHIERLVAEGSRHLAHEGLLAFEIGMGQEGKVGEILEADGSYGHIFFRKDLAGVTRIALAYGQGSRTEKEGDTAWRSS